MITDVHNAECQVATFSIGPATTTTRSWDIKITQYARGDDDKGGKCYLFGICLEFDTVYTYTLGPPGCLQYFTGTEGVVASYAFSATTVVAGKMKTVRIHLQRCSLMS